jgi:hypothetical protein
MLSDARKVLQQELMKAVTDNYMDPGDRRAVSWQVISNSKMAQTLVSGYGPAPIIFSDNQFIESFCTFYGLQSPESTSVRNYTMAGVNNNTRVTVNDIYGGTIRANNRMRGGYTKAMHDTIVQLLVSIAEDAGIRCLGGKHDTVCNKFKHLIQQNVNFEAEGDEPVHRILQGIIPDGYFDGTILPRVHGDNIFADKKIIFDVKTLADGPTYMESYQAQSPLKNVRRRQEKVSKDYINHARDIDLKYNAQQIPPGGKGPVEREILNVYNGAKGMVIGPFGEVSTNVETYLDFIARHKSRLMSDGLDSEQKAKVMRWIRRTNRAKLGLLIHREWAEMLIAKANIIRTEGRT